MIVSETSKEINAYALDEDKKILLWLLSKYKYSSSWDFVARCTFKKYGGFSYQSNRIWKPTPEGYILYNNRDLLPNQ